MGCVCVVGGYCVVAVVGDCVVFVILTFAVVIEWDSVVAVVEP